MVVDPHAVKTCILAPFDELDQLRYRYPDRHPDVYPDLCAPILHRVELTFRAALALIPSGNSTIVAAASGSL
jgi:hypothetical protein